MLPGSRAAWTALRKAAVRFLILAVTIESVTLSISDTKDAAASLKQHAERIRRPRTWYTRFVRNAWDRRERRANAYADAPRSGRPTIGQQHNISDKALTACYKDLSQGYVWQGSNTTMRAYQVGRGCDAHQRALPCWLCPLVAEHPRCAARLDCTLIVNKSLKSARARWHLTWGKGSTASDPADGGRRLFAATCKQREGASSLRHGGSTSSRIHKLLRCCRGRMVPPWRSCRCAPNLVAPSSCNPKQHHKQRSPDLVLAQAEAALPRTLN